MHLETGYSTPVFFLCLWPTMSIGVGIVNNSWAKMNENGLYFHRFAFFNFLRHLFCGHPENHTNRELRLGALSIRPNIPVWNTGYSMRRMEQYFPVPWTNPSYASSLHRAQLHFDLNTLRVGGEIFESGNKKLLIQKYPDTCEAGLSVDWISSTTVCWKRLER